MRSPAVSVIIPTYHREHLLPRAIDSVLSQTFEDFEVLVIDDGPSAATAAVVADYEKRDRRVRYCAQPVNSGLSAARNRGLRESTGRYVTFLDDDDEWMHDKLKRQIDIFSYHNDDIGMVYGGITEVVDINNRVCDSYQRTPIHRGYIYENVLESNVIYGGGSTVMLRGQVVDLIGYFDENLNHAEDWEYWIRVSKSFKVDFVPEPIARYYLSDPNRMSANLARALESRSQIYDKYESDLRKAKKAHLFMLQTARRHLESQSPDRIAIIKLALRAASIEPFQTAPYRMIVRALSPRAFLRLLTVARRVRGEIAMRQ